jgi:hypothetical protein
MNKELIKLLLSSLGALLYTWLFWDQDKGINLLIFTSFTLVAVWQVFPETQDKKEVLLAMFATLLTALIYVVQHSTLSLIAHYISFFLWIGLLQQQTIRFIFFGFLLGFYSFFSVPAAAKRILTKQLPKAYSFHALSHWLPFVLIPCTLVFLLGGLYYRANLPFARMVDFVIPYISWDIANISWAIWLMVKGLFVCMALLVAAPGALKLSQREAQFPAYLNRYNRKRKAAKGTSVLGLKREYWAAITTLATLNLLLFFVNVADLRFVWFGSAPASAQELSQYVHEGTYLLILALLIAMAVLLWYFRGNLNFYQDTGLLKKMAYIWLAQNAMLAISVGIRNWAYVQEYGLAYKRLGVFWFLLLVAFGLFTLVQKITSKHSLFHLANRNGWAIFLSLLMASAINWDCTITRYNLSLAPEKSLDARFLFYGISDHNLSLLWKHKALIAQQSSWDEQRIERELHSKYRKFEERMKSQAWKAWNIKDARNEKVLQKMRASEKEASPLGK